LRKEIHKYATDNLVEEENCITKEKILISVIIPVYFEEKIIDFILSKYDYIRKKYPVEIIVSDGGSKDRTLEIAKYWADKVVQHTESRKQTISEGRNKGAEIAEGDVLVFINGDTYPADLDVFFKFIYDWALRNNRYNSFDALTCSVSIEPQLIKMKDKIFYALHNRYIKLLNIIGIGMGRGECQIVRKDLFQKVGGYDISLAAGEDFDLFRRIRKITKIGYVSDLVVYENPRRFRKYGYLKVIFSWLLNSIYVMIYGKSSSNYWEPVR